jgi:RHS repeat-associated protein
MPGRKYSATNSYRYGFNDKENDNDVKGEGNQQDYGLRIYDPRTGKFLSVDPLQTKYPELTPYQFASNTPIESVDLDGGERLSYLQRNESHNLVDFAGNLPGNVFVAGANAFAGAWNKVVDYGSAVFNSGDPIGGLSQQVGKDWDDFSGTMGSIWNYHAKTPAKQQAKDFINDAKDLDNWSKATEGAALWYMGGKVTVALKTETAASITTTNVIKTTVKAAGVPVAAVAVDYVALAAKYLKNRPRHFQKNINAVWEASKKADGKVYDPNTGRELFWDKMKVRNGQWDMGHTAEYKYEFELNKLREGKITEEQFLENYHNPNNYRAEGVAENRGRKYDPKKSE